MAVKKRNEKEISEKVQWCDYSIEANKIANANLDAPAREVNIADATYLYQMGYEAAQERINKLLKPIHHGI